MGYIAVAKGDKKVFFIVEGLLGNSINLVFNIIAYNFWGLKGMGISFLISYAIYFYAILMITKRLYNFEISRKFVKIFVFYLLLWVFALILSLVSGPVWIYSAGAIIFGISIFFTIKELDKRIELKSLLLSLANK